MKLLLVDGSALLHRAYHAYPPLTTKTGQVVGAVYGVASMLYSALVEVAPTHVMVAWDLPKPTFRHEKYVGYKAQRPKADSEMVEQIPMVKKVIEAMGVKQLAEEGYEADDIIGTLARQFSDDKVTNTQTENKVIILTGDQDTMQLVGDNVAVLTPPKGKAPAKLYGVKEVIEKYGVSPEQIVDYKALIGDPSDNIPGVAGIGPVTAAKLLMEYKTLDGIYKALDLTSQIANFKLGSQVAEKLVSGKESALLSQDLSRIVTEMPIKIDDQEIEYHDIKTDKLKELLEELGFKSFLRRLYQEEFDPPSRKASDGHSNQMGLF